LNAALKQICCCSWKGDVRVREDATCAVHGIDPSTRERARLEGEVRATAEGLRDQRSVAMAALFRYRRTKRHLIALRKRLECL